MQKKISTEYNSFVSSLARFPHQDALTVRIGRGPERERERKVHITLLCSHLIAIALQVKARSLSHTAENEKVKRWVWNLLTANIAKYKLKSKKISKTLDSSKSVFLNQPLIIL